MAVVVSSMPVSQRIKKRFVTFTLHGLFASVARWRHLPRAAEQIAGQHSIGIPMTRRNHLRLFSFVLSLSVQSAPAPAQTKPDEAALCAAENIGSAIGAGACFGVRLDAAEAKLAGLEARHASAVVAASNNPAYAKRVVEAEATFWRQYRGARCALYGETEGGSEGWKSAFATSCALEESNARIESLRKALAGK